MRRLIIGDIHGCLDELQELVRKIKLDEERDELIQLGDMIDRGPDPCGVLEFFRDLKRRMGDRCVLVRGNHEQILLEAVRDPELMDLWSANGGMETVRSMEERGLKPEDWVSWLTEETVLFYQTDGFLCAHAGVEHEKGEENSEDTLLWDRNQLLENRYGGSLAIVGHTPLSVAAYMDGTGGPARALPDGRLRPLPKRGMICLDTGCVFGGKLSAMSVRGGFYTLHSVGRGGTQP